MDEEVEYLMFEGEFRNLQSGTRVMITNGPPHEGYYLYRVPDDYTEEELQEQLENETVLTTFVVE